MPKYKVKTLCQNADKTWADVVHTGDITAAALMLGNLYVIMKDCSKKDAVRILNTVSTLKTAVTAQGVNRLWQKIHDPNVSAIQIMTPENQLTLQALRTELIRDPAYSRHLSDEQIINYANGILHYREVCIGLIRRHMATQGKNDPFQVGDFNYALIGASGAEHNYLYVSRYIAQCDSLPIASLATLGKAPELANLILQDTQSHASWFELASRFATIHPTLRPTIAREWHKYLSTFPMEANHRIAMLKLLEPLKQDFTEFKEIPVGERLQRNFEPSPVPVPERRWVGPLKLGAAFVAGTAGIETTISLLAKATLPLFPFTFHAAVGSIGLIGFVRAFKKDRAERRARREAQLQPQPGVALPAERYRGVQPR